MFIDENCFLFILFLLYIICEKKHFFQLAYDLKIICQKNKKEKTQCLCKEKSEVLQGKRKIKINVNYVRLYMYIIRYI